MEADAIELRVLGCLIEKQHTTPDAYPLSLNSIRLAANQSTNRDPVMQLDEGQIRDALQRLYHKRWTRLAGAARAAKYRHLLDEALGVDDGELCLLAVLLLRGPQTPGELNQRVARLHAFASMDELLATLGRLIDRSLIARLERRPGQKEERYVQLLGDTGALEDAAPAPDRIAAAPPPPPAPPPAPAAPVDEGRLERLEREVAQLRAEVAELREALGG
jgi:uncharacterized protein YceH (UPF0502 family)